MTTFFVDDLDGEWTVGVDHGMERGTESVITVSGEDDWIYPEDIEKQIGEALPYVLNVYSGGKGVKPELDVYILPDDWESRVTKNHGIDHLPSIHDLMRPV